MQPDTPVRRLPLPDQRGWPERFGDGRTERDAVLRLAHMGSVSPGNLRALAWREGSARRCIRAARRGVVGAADIERLDGVDPGAVRAALARLGARFVLPGEPEFPPQLLDLADPPGWLFVRGRPLHELGSTAVAVVGARNCSLYGREAAEWIGGGLASAGVVVVSGAARGIDAASHRGALAAGGPTVAVLGSGIDRPYPAAHRALLDGVAAAGTVVSEYPPGTPASKPRFPAGTGSWPRWLGPWWSSRGPRGAAR